MNTLLENRHTRDKALAKELFSYYFFKRPFYIIADILMLAILLLNLFLRNYWLIAFPLLFCFSQFFMYQQTTSAFVRQNMKEDGPENVTSYISEDTVRNVSSDESESEISFTDIKIAVKAKNHYILITSKNELYPISRNGFTVGCEKDFSDLLKSKKIKISLL